MTIGVMEQHKLHTMPYRHLDEAPIGSLAHDYKYLVEDRIPYITERISQLERGAPNEMRVVHKENSYIVSFSKVRQIGERLEKECNEKYGKGILEIGTTLLSGELDYDQSSILFMYWCRNEETAFEEIKKCVDLKRMYEHDAEILRQVMDQRCEELHVNLSDIMEKVDHPQNHNISISSHIGGDNNE